MGNLLSRGGARTGPPVLCRQSIYQVGSRGIKYYVLPIHFHEVWSNVMTQGQLGRNGYRVHWNRPYFSESSSSAFYMEKGRRVLETSWCSIQSRDLESHGSATD